MKKTLLLLSLLAATSISHAQTAATVNGVEIPQSRIDDFAKALETQQKQPVSPEMRLQIKERLIMQELMVQAANSRGIQNQPEVKKQIQLATNDVLVNALVEDIAKQAAPTDEALKATYEQLKQQQLAGPDNKEFQMRHILVQDEKTANAILADLKAKKKSFEELAKQFTLDEGTKANGGSLGWTVPRAALVPDFANAVVAKGSKGLLPTPVKTQFGFHVVEIQDIRTINFPAFDEVKGQLRNAELSKAIQQFQQELRKNATVQQ